MKNLPDSKQTVRALRNIVGSIDKLTATRAPLENQLALMKKNDITSGTQYDKLVREIATIDSKLAPLMARRSELEEPFRAEFNRAHAERDRRYPELTALEREVARWDEAALNGKISAAIKDLTESGMTETEARRSSIVLALNDQRSEYKAKWTAAKAAKDGAWSETHDIVEHCYKILKPSEYPAEFANTKGGRYLAILAFGAAFLIMVSVLSAATSSHVGKVLIWVQVCALAYMGYSLIGSRKDRVKVKETWQDESHSSWLPFAGACASAFVMLFVGFLPYNSSNAGFINGVESLVSLAATVGVFLFFDKFLDTKKSVKTEDDEAQWKAQRESEWTREDDIRHGFNKLKRNVENDIIDYGKK